MTTHCGAGKNNATSVVGKSNASIAGKKHHGRDAGK